MIRPLLAVGFILPLTISPAFGEAFCLEGGGQPRQCLYDDPALCRRDARPPATVCIANPGFPWMVIGAERFCVARASRSAECLYVDQRSCDSAATAGGGVCLDRGRSRTSPVDPFRLDPRPQF